MKRKNGYVLILSLVIISLLLVFATTVITLAVSAYKSTKRFEDTSKLKLVAESGIEKGKLILKNYLLVNTNRVDSSGNTFSYLKFNPDKINTDLTADLSYVVDDITCIITFSPNDPNDTMTFFDASTGRNISYIEITAKAEKGSMSKSFSVILDKTAISNIYFDQLFHTSITVVDVINNSLVESANISDNSALDLTGNVYLQGSLINFFPNSSDFRNSYEGGRIVANCYNLKTKISSLNDLSGKSIDLLQNSTAASVTGWQNSTIRTLKVLPIFPVTEPGADPVLDLSDGHAPTVEDLKNNAIFKDQVDPFLANDNTVHQPPTLVTYKIKNSVSPINFREIVDGPNWKDNEPCLYQSIIKVLIDRAQAGVIPPNPPLTDGVANGIAESEYGGFYKLILVDGDLNIENNSEENFVNYLIYCTGKVTFQGEAHFYNSSIFAKQLVTNSNGKPIEFFGVNSAKASAYIIGQDHLTDFTPMDKMIINYYLIKNLDGYADNLSYKIVQWK